MKIYLVLLFATLSAFGADDCPEEETGADKIKAKILQQAPFTHRAATIEECANQIIKDDMGLKGNKVYSIHSAVTGEGGHYVQDYSWQKFERGEVGNLEMYFAGRQGQTLQLFGGEVRIFAQKSSDRKTVQCGVNPDPNFLKKGIWYSPEKRPWYAIKPGFEY
ncbi:MAG: hypothetical protein ACJ76H_12860 [Bacteriovoracaceae bacterium]